MSGARVATALCAVVALIAGCTSSARVPTLSPRSTFSEPGARLLEAHRVPGLVAAQIERGQVVAIEPLGFANRATRTPMTKDTVVQAGTLSQSVAAWVLMRQVQEERLELDTPLSYYLRPWPLEDGAWSALVTLRRVLSHTAGTNIPLYEGTGLATPLPDLRSSLGSARDPAGVRLRVEREPGSWSYSSGGYALAELAAETVAGRHFPELAHRTILAPLSMTRSSFRQPEREPPYGAATAYDRNGEPLPVRRFASAAAAGLWTTGQDLAKWVAALLIGPAPRLPGRGALDPHTIAQMMSPQPGADCGLLFQDCVHGLGYALVRLDGEHREILAFATDESGQGWSGLVAALPSRRSGFVVLTNGAAGGALARDALCWWLGHQGAGGVPECETGRYVAAGPHRPVR